MGTELAHYPEARGLPELRGVAQQRFERNHHVRPPLEEIVITNGAMQGLQLSAQGLARPGDTVIMEEFEYGGTIRVFKQCGLQLVPRRRSTSTACAWTRSKAVLERAGRQRQTVGLHLHHRQLPESDRDEPAARAPPEAAGARRASTTC